MAFGLNDILTLLSPGYAMGRGASHLYRHNKGFFQGKPEEQQQIQRFTPEQQQALNQLLQQGLQNADFGGIEELEKRRLGQETIPGIAERFTAMGVGGPRSSAFANAMGGAASDLGTRLGALRSQFGMQQLGMGLTPQFDTRMKPGSEGIFGLLGGSASSMLPQLLKLLI